MGSAVLRRVFSMKVFGGSRGLFSKSPLAFRPPAFSCAFSCGVFVFASHLKRLVMRGRGPSQTPKFLSPAALSPWLGGDGAFRIKKHSERVRERVFRDGRAK